MSDFFVYLGVGALSGLLAGLFGVGGGVVLVPALILSFAAFGLGAEWTAQLAVGTSLAAILATGLVSAYAHHHHGAVRWPLAARLAPALMLGAGLGSLIAGHVPGQWLQWAFAVFLVYVSARLLMPLRRRPGTGLPGALGLWSTGILIGTLSALVGIGGGTLTVPFLSRGGLDLRRAIATSAACGVPIAGAGAAGMILSGWGREGLPAWSSGFVHWPAVGAILLSALPMAPLGARLAHRLRLKPLRLGFALLLLALAAHLAMS